MSTIFNSSDNDFIISRINQLTPESKAHWGKMNVSQMIVHCQQPLLVSEGKLGVKRSLIGIVIGNLMKKKFLNKKFGKNLPTDKKFIITYNPEFEKEKQLLINQIQSFEKKGNSVIKNFKHPFFGSMTAEEWGIISYKHLDHHLKQFGV
ncbi:MAG: DUF1569 domain-containing protein [Flavobacterium sp.]|nr:DUF1569 domain-containing protein [Flavobacterium sp.]